MTNLNAVRTAKVAILTDNVLEAADLKDMLDHMSLSPVVSLRNADKALNLFRETRLNADLVVFGWSLSNATAVKCLEQISQSGAGIVMIDAPSDAADEIGARMVQRPFTTEDIMAALHDLKHTS